MTPRSFSASVNEASLLYAPRALKEPVRCRFSNFKNIAPSFSLPKILLGASGVWIMIGFNRRYAAAIPRLSVNTSSITNVPPFLFFYTLIEAQNL